MTRPMDPSPIHRGSGTLRVRTSATAATRKNPTPIASRVIANPSMSPHRGYVISSVPRWLPPASVAQPGDDPLLVAPLEHLGQAKTDRMVQGLVCENVEHHSAPVPVGRSESARVCVAQVPQVDHRRAPVLGGIPVRETERDRRPKKPRPRGPCDPGQLRFGDLRLPEVEHPADASVAQRGNRIVIGPFILDVASGDDGPSEADRFLPAVAK